MAKAKKNLSPVEDVVIPLAASTTFLAAIMNEIDEAEDITETIKHRFNTDQLIQKENVDQTIVARDQLEAMKARAKEISRREFLRRLKETRGFELKLFGTNASRKAKT